MKGLEALLGKEVDDLLTVEPKKADEGMLLEEAGDPLEREMP